MDIAVENISELTRKVTITLPAKDVRKALDKSYKKLKKDVKLKGFRRGKIPIAVLEKNFGEQVQAEVGEKMVQETYFDAIEEKDIDPVVHPEITETNFADDGTFMYVAMLDVKPEIDLKQHKGLEVPARVVPRAEQHAEMGTDTYFGGVVFEKHASLDPALYHQGLLDRALGAGVQIVTHCPVTGIEKSGNGFDVKTGRGTTQARDVIVATNGYTGSVTPWLRRRVIPIGSYIIATEPLPRETVDRLMPHDRSYSDSRKVVHYYRRSPDGTRILFGGRVSAGETDTKKSAPLLRKNLIEIFPEMSEVKISHSWMGFVAYTFDTLAHVGQQDGLHYAMGYCGSGVSMASYMGMRVGNKVLGLAEGHTGSDDVPFQTRPLYYGKPWFLSGSVAYYRWRDRRNV